MIGKIKNLGKRQIIITVISIMVLSVGIVTSVILLKKENKEEIKKCLIEFDTNGGTFISSKEIECGSKINEPEEKPEKIGFEFLGWTYKETPFDFNTKIKESVILVATYNKTTEEEIIKVSFNSNGGSEVKEIELVKGTSITEPVKPVRDKYNFIGWYKNEEKFDFSQKINESITLEAKWEKKTTQNSTKPNGGSSTGGNQGGSSTVVPEPTPDPEPKPDPKPEDKYVYVGAARLVDGCSKSDYTVDYGFCYKTAYRKSYYGCEGREIDGKCYKISSVLVKYSCNGEDKYFINGGHYCAPKINEIREPLSDGSCPGKLYGEYTLNADGKCEGYYYNENKGYRYPAIVTKYCGLCEKI